ncbi:GNAT family protein [Sediminitomix flava]|uniref:Arginine-tRNA-protein transferase n=1 Tax=Sediminitomix flava TaxID=379075 RepID=A0A315ZF41_SEDFL|nr:arginine-tRNA-protein transferase [Sediminitomix flava]PWJ44131.1 arginine-tRNA-protein transferase [Sediminitomix flava]
MTTKLILDEFVNEKVSPSIMDQLLSLGWRHFGERFFRYNLSIYEGKVCRVLPLRINLRKFDFNKKQRKIIKKAKDFTIVIRDLEIDDEKLELFEEHKHKFKESVPQSIYEFISRKDPAMIPCLTKEVCVYDGDILVACSIMDVAERSCSSIYAMYRLEYAQYSLGTYTLLLEIEYAKMNGFLYHYHGYCYDVPSFYDYKKRFEGLEFFDWYSGWKKYPPKDLRN